MEVASGFEPLQNGFADLQIGYKCRKNPAIPGLPDSGPPGKMLSFYPLSRKILGKDARCRMRTISMDTPEARSYAGEVGPSSLIDILLLPVSIQF